MTRSLLFVLLLLVADGVAAQSTEDSDLENLFPKVAIVIEADVHRCYHFDVYLAKSFELQRRGLMYVRDLPRMTGMLFIYDRPGIRLLLEPHAEEALERRPVGCCRGPGSTSGQRCPWATAAAGA